VYPARDREGSLTAHRREQLSETRKKGRWMRATSAPGPTNLESTNDGGESSCACRSNSPDYVRGSRAPGCRDRNADGQLLPRAGRERGRQLVRVGVEHCASCLHHVAYLILITGPASCWSPRTAASISMHSDDVHSDRSRLHRSRCVRAERSAPETGARVRHRFPRMLRQAVRDPPVQRQVRAGASRRQ
jgi:hypothetical protein